MSDQEYNVDLEYKVDYSAPKRDISLVEAPETQDSVEWLIPRDDEDSKELSRLVPWREGRKMFRDFVDCLPRPSINSADEDDHKCPICWDKYDSAGLGAECDIAVKLTCGHIMGSYCLFEWMEDHVGQGCPLCRRDIMLQDSRIKEIRAEDMKRYLFWRMRTQGENIGIHILRILEWHKIEQLILKCKFARSINHITDAAEIQKTFRAALHSRGDKNDTPFLEAFCQRTASRVTRSGKSGLEWLRTSTIKAAAECILRRMSGYALAKLVDDIIDDPGAEEEIKSYVADEEFGPYGSREDYSDLPGITLGHFHSSKPTRRTVFMHGFNSGFPILLDWEVDDDDNLVYADPNPVLPFPSSHEGTRDILDGDDGLCAEHLFGPVG